MTKKVNPTSAANMVFVACCILGPGIGMLTNTVGAASVIGVGVGFLLRGLVEMAAKEKSALSSRNIALTRGLFTCL